MTTLRDVFGPRSRVARCWRTLLAGAVGVVGVVGLTPRSAHGAAARSVAVPAYFWSSTQWDRMLVSSQELRYVVMNPDSGPGTVSYPSFVTKVATARTQGAMVVGYVDTGYGARALATVKAEIDKYRTWYGVNAFFFDQTPYDCAQIAYYQQVEDYVRAQAGGFIFHNPGMNPQECYLDVADVVVNFEGSEASYNAWTPAPYAAGYPADRFWHIVYAVDPAHAAALLSSAASRNGGLVFLTEQDMPNPFSVIPVDALWSAQTPTRSGRKAAPQAAPPSTTAPVPATPRLAAPQSPSPTTTSPEGAAAAVPVTTRPAAADATGATTTSIATGSAQNAPVPLMLEPVPTTSASSSNSLPTTVAPTTSAPTSPPLSPPSAPVPAVRSGQIAGDTFVIVPPAPIGRPGPFVTPAPDLQNSTAEWGLAERPVPDPAVTSAVRSAAPSPTTTRPPAGPALVPTTPAVTRVALRVAATRTTSARRVVEVPKKTPAARRRPMR